MPKLFSIFLIFILFVSCNSDKSELNPIVPPIPGQILIIDGIVMDGGVDAIFTGLGGGKSDQYKRYEWMKSKLSNSALHQLTDHQSPAVRVYAFLALSDRGYWSLGEIVKKHKHDTASFISRAGCMGMRDQVNKCFQRIVEGNN